jgi:hypothetical protein
LYLMSSQKSDFNFQGIDMAIFFRMGSKNMSCLQINFN